MKIHGFDPNGPPKLYRRLAVTGAAILVVLTIAIVKGKLFGEFSWHVGL